MNLIKSFEDLSFVKEGKLSVNLELSLDCTKVPKKTTTHAVLDENYKKGVLAIDCSLSENLDKDTFKNLDLKDLQTLTKKERTRMITKNNIIIPVEKLPTLLKTYPKLVGNTKITPLIDKNLTQDKVNTLSRTVLLKPKKDYLRLAIGKTTEDLQTLYERILVIRKDLENSNYILKKGRVGTTQGKSLELKL